MKPKPIRLSPSNLERFAMCPGAYAAEEGLPYKESEWNAEGKLMHAAMARNREALEQLNKGQLWDIDICNREARRLHQEVFGGQKVKGFAHEKKLSIKLEDDVVLSGQLDYFGHDTQQVLLIDWKFGRGEVAEAANNLQTRAYAVLLDAFMLEEGYGMGRVVVALVQPRAPLDERVTVCEYSGDDIQKARNELKDIAAGIRFCSDQRNPGSHCRYCKALGTQRCLESAQTSADLAPLTLGDVMPTPEHLTKVLDICNVAEHVIEKYRDYAKEFIAAGGVIPGYSLVPGNNVRKLKDTDSAWKAAQSVLDPEEFMGACSVSVTKLEAKMAEKRGWKKNEARPTFDSIMGDAVTREQNAPSLKRTEKQLSLMGGQPQ